MKVLIVGGANQGKRGYACVQYNIRENEIGNGAERATPEFWNKYMITSLHALVWQLMKLDLSPTREVLDRLAGRESWILVCDEVGCGVVPLDAFTRRWREEVGRLCCELAVLADVVERVNCGIALRLKGDLYANHLDSTRQD